jgi:hypothetical protein
MDGAIGYVAYTVIGPGAAHAIAVDRLDSSLLRGVATTGRLPIPQWVESPSLFERAGRYYLAYSDPICAFCVATGTSYAIGSTPLGPFSELRHAIAAGCERGQPASVDQIDGGYLYQADLWSGSMDETAAGQLWQWLAFDGSTISSLCL